MDGEVLAATRHARRMSIDAREGDVSQASGRCGSVTESEGLRDHGSGDMEADDIVDSSAAMMEAAAGAKLGASSYAVKLKLGGRAGKNDKIPGQALRLQINVLSVSLHNPTGLLHSCHAYEQLAAPCCWPCEKGLILSLEGAADLRFKAKDVDAKDICQLIQQAKQNFDAVAPAESENSSDDSDDQVEVAKKVVEKRQYSQAGRTVTLHGLGGRKVQLNGASGTVIHSEGGRFELAVNGQTVSVPKANCTLELQEESSEEDSEQESSEDEKDGIGTASSSASARLSAAVEKETAEATATTTSKATQQQAQAVLGQKLYSAMLSGEAVQLEVSGMGLRVYDQSGGSVLETHMYERMVSWGVEVTGKGFEVELKDRSADNINTVAFFFTPGFGDEICAAMTEKASELGAAKRKKFKEENDSFFTAAATAARLPLESERVKEDNDDYFTRAPALETVVSTAPSGSSVTPPDSTAFGKMPAAVVESMVQAKLKGKAVQLVVGGMGLQVTCSQ